MFERNRARSTVSTGPCRLRVSYQRGKMLSISELPAELPVVMRVSMKA
ncbi:MAG: hypothetical protein ACJA07_003845 [Rhodococcus sp. (in: high G+C Gram-positive bacteria)]|jgi:hypothetical protein